MDDLPPELRQRQHEVGPIDHGWEQALRAWADQRLSSGAESLLSSATPAFERIMIEAALQQTGGRRQEAARLLGWGRNTLTRKIKELELPDTGDA